MIWGRCILVEDDIGQVPYLRRGMIETTHWRCELNSKLEGVRAKIQSLRDRLSISVLATVRRRSAKVCPSGLAIVNLHKVEVSEKCVAIVE